MIKIIHTKHGCSLQYCVAQVPMQLAIDNLDSKRLYKFRSINHEKIYRIRNLFFNDELYFPSPAELNDPWESKPHISVGYLTDPEYKKKFIRWAFKIMTEPGAPGDPVEKLLWLNNLSQSEAVALTQELETNLHEDLKAYRIYSFSANSTHPLLWSHYANSHKGFCLEFDCSNDFFGSALKVEYQEDYPGIDIVDQDENYIVNASILTKAKFWDYEDEYRLVSMEPNYPDALPVTNNILKFPGHLLLKVIFGCQMEQAEKDLIKNWCKDRTPPIMFEKAIKSSNAFKLEIVPE